MSFLQIAHIQMGMIFLRTLEKPAQGHPQSPYDAL